MGSHARQRDVKGNRAAVAPVQVTTNRRFRRSDVVICESAR